MSRREFHFVDGKSSKFWAIELGDKAFSVQWGRIGTNGQTQSKEFGSDAEAKRQHDKLIAEKVSKGYTEVGAGAATAGTTPTPKTASPKPTPKPAKAPTEEKPVVQEAPAPAPAVLINANVERSIDLTPNEWAVASWRPRARLEAVPTRPFDLEKRKADIARVPVRTYGWDWDWSFANIPFHLSPEEAHFWLTAMCSADNKISSKELAEQVAKGEFKKIGLEDVNSLLKNKKTNLRPEVLVPLINLVSLEELLELLEEKRSSSHRGHRHESLLSDDPEVTFGFQRYILPYLTDAQIDQLRTLLRPNIDIKDWPTDHYHRAPVSFYLAAMLGFSDQLLPVVQQWKEGFYNESGWDHTHYHQPQVIVLGLGDAKIVEAEMRRHKLPLNRPEYIRGWLATTEYAALDYVRDSILAITNREECEKLLKTFTVVHAPEAAPHMLELKLSSKAPKIAREWLETNLGCTIAGLIPAAAGRGKLADAAIEQLLDLRRAGHGDLIAKTAGDPAPERVRKEVLEHLEKSYAPFDAASTPAWLTTASADAPKAAKLPGWLPVHSVPPLTVGEHRLNDAQMQALLASLQKSPLDAPSPLIQAVREHASRESRDAFAWRLFEMWQAEGAPSKEKWALGTVGHIGSDGCVLKLTPLVRNWPGESQHQRAVFGLECLRAIGSDTALMSLNGIAQKLKFKGLKTKAMEYMDAIATQRGMTRAQLEDRIIPDCDLDERGTRIFDFGSRQFRLVLGPEMKPMIKDADGKVKGDLPAPNSKDDAAKAKEAVDTWKLLKKQVKEVAKVQAERLEQSMITGRRWTPEEFRTLLLKHPLMTNLARLAVWGVYDRDAKLTGTFRVTEDQTLADDQDSETEISADTAHVGIVHPAHLSKDTLAAWGQIFSDYEIIPAFEQLGRRVNTLEADEKDQTDFKRFAKIKVEAVTLVGILERLAWLRGIPQDAGIFYEHTKPFYGANVTCVVQYDPGVGVGYMLESDDQSDITAFFIPGVYSPKMYPDHKKRLKLSQVDAVVVSEMIRDLNVIASKAKA